MTVPLTDLDLAGASARISRAEISPVDLTEAYLERIEETGWANAWVTIDAEGARASARRAAEEVAARRIRGPLHGIPVGVKDLIDTAGLRTTYGSARFRDHVPAEDAAVVARLRNAGAVVLGKQATHEFAWGGRTDGRHFGPTVNPHDRTRVPGGSSGGGAASIALHSSLLAVGTDTAGSCRIPAALSGCVGFKPTSGWLSLDGVFPLAASLDHLGILTRTVADAAVAFSALGGTSADADPRSVGVPSGRSREILDVPVAAGLDDACARLEEAGVTVREVPDDPNLDERPMALLTWVRAEAERVHRDSFARDRAAYGDDLAAVLDLGPVTEAELKHARDVVARSVHWLQETLREVDLVMTATVPIVAPLIGEMTAELGGAVVHVEQALTRLTSLANAAGVPALSTPGGVGGLPVGVQLLGPRHGDGLVLSAGALLEVGRSSH